MAACKERRCTHAYNTYDDTSVVDSIPSAPTPHDFTSVLSFHTGLGPLRYFDFTQVDYVNLGSLTTMHHNGLASMVMSLLIDIIPASKAITYALKDDILAMDLI